MTAHVFRLEGDVDADRLRRRTRLLGLPHRRPPTTSAVVAAPSCMPASLNQEVRLALGAQAGEQRLAEMLDEAGLSRVRRSAETPFNVVLEVRP